MNRTNPSDVRSSRSDDQVVVEITIAAPAARVFDALADPAQRVQWWAVQGRFRATHMVADLRPGGAWSMRGEGLQGPFEVRGHYRVVEPPRVLEFTWQRDREPSTLVRFELTERDGATAVRLVHSGLAAEGIRSRYQSWPALLDMLRGHAQRAAGGSA